MLFPVLFKSNPHLLEDLHFWKMFLQENWNNSHWHHLYIHVFISSILSFLGPCSSIKKMWIKHHLYSSSFSALLSLTVSSRGFIVMSCIPIWISRKEYMSVALKHLGSLSVTFWRHATERQHTSFNNFWQTDCCFSLSQKGTCNYDNHLSLLQVEKTGRNFLFAESS